MKKNDLFYLLLIVIVFFNCGKNDTIKPEPKKDIKQLIIISKDYINANVFENTSVYNYVYINGVIKEITTEGRTHIVFAYKNNKVIEKRYFNNLENISSIDSFFYDQLGNLELINSYNNSDCHIQSSELTYNNNRVSKVVRTIFYPNTIVEEYDFKYSGSNIKIADLTSGSLNSRYIFQYDGEDNIQDLDFYQTELGVYTTGVFSLNSTTLPIIFSANRIRSIRGYNNLGVQLFEYNFEHSIPDDKYSALDFRLYDKNQELLNSTNIIFKY